MAYFLSHITHRIASIIGAGTAIACLTIGSGYRSAPTDFTIMSTKEMQEAAWARERLGTATITMLGRNN